MWLRSYPVTTVALLTLLVGVLWVPLSGERDTLFPVHDSDETTTILFGGDVMLDRTVRAVADVHGFDFLLEPLIPLMRAHDVVVFNLEGPITSYDSVSVGSLVGEPANTQFTFSSSTAFWLGERGFVAHIGNNHINDFGRSGIEETLRYGQEAEALLFGDAGRMVQNHLVRRVGNVTLGLVSFNQFVEGSFARAKETLATLKPHVDVLVLYAHWGEEYETEPSPTLKAWAESFVLAGADLVVGSHPHVFGAHERLRGVEIYYSLGNLVFDQYWNSDVRCGALLSVTLEKQTVTKTEVIPVYLDINRQTIPAGDRCFSISYK